MKVSRRQIKSAVIALKIVHQMMFKEQTTQAEREACEEMDAAIGDFDQLLINGYGTPQYFEVEPVEVEGVTIPPRNPATDQKKFG